MRSPTHDLNLAVSISTVFSMAMGVYLGLSSRQLVHMH